MPVPDFQTLMLPVLRALSGGEQLHVTKVCLRVAKAEGLTHEDQSERMKDGASTKLQYRVSWCFTYFINAGLVERVSRAVYHITSEGEQLLSQNPVRIDRKLLLRYPKFVEWIKPKTSGDDIGKVSVDPGSETPDETIDRAVAELRRVLEAEVLDRVRESEPAFLEQVVVDLLIKMGYGGGDRGKGQVTGGSGDGGIDGTIKEDALGLDEVYLQAKRYKADNTVGEGDLRNFAGAIDAAGTTKGVFVTTASFTKAARDYVARSPKRIVLLDGNELARRMVHHGIGVRTRALHEIKRIDEDYFDQSVV